MCALRLIPDCASYTQMDVRSPDIVQQLRAAFEGKGWSVQELLDRSRLDIDRSSLARKLDGELPMKVKEAEVLARTLDAVIVWPPRRKRAA